MVVGSPLVTNNRFHDQGGLGVGQEAIPAKGTDHRLRFRANANRSRSLYPRRHERFADNVREQRVTRR
jgi:hypothetical protein